MSAKQTNRSLDASSKPRVGLLAALRRPSAASSESSAGSEDDGSELERDTPVQTSRIASLSPKQQSKSAPSQEEKEEDSDNGAAYERMKIRLAASKSTEEPHKTRGLPEGAPLAAAVISSEDEDETPVRTNMRRSNVRKAKSQSPSPSASPALSTRSRQSSPGLFVTPNATPMKSRAPRSGASDSEATPRPLRNADSQERTTPKRLGKEEEAQTRQKNAKASRRRIQNDSDSDTDGENGRRLTQQAKPTRKAGKKAMEIMARDQQRISRNMQLTHQSKTKKKHGMSELFSRFGYNAPVVENLGEETLPTPEQSSALVSSDAEANKVRDTPPTSPPRQELSPVKEVTSKSMPIQDATLNEFNNEVPLQPSKLDKGKGRAPEFQHLPPRSWEKQNEELVVQNVQSDVKKPVNHAMVELSDSDDDLEVVQTKGRFPVFDRIPLKKQQESSSLLHLRHLAHLTSSNDSRKGPKSISLGDMQMSLAQKAREQGQKEREEKVAELKRRGIHIETEEERAKNEMEIDDMVAQFEKQRQEDLKLAKSERAEAKKNGETIDDLPSSDGSDDDYVGSGEEDTHAVEVEADNDEQAELELSGSEDEAMEDEGDGEAEEDGNTNDPTVDMADENDEELGVDIQEQQFDEDADMEDEAPSAPVRKRTVTRTRNMIIDDDDESDDETPRSASPTQQATQDEAMAAFGFGNGNADTGLGLTQMFAGTMANLETGSQHPAAEPEQDSLDFLRGLPDTQPGANFSQASDFVVPNSQLLMSPQKDSQIAPETQFSLGISQLIKSSPAVSRTQLEDFPEPTQDAGFSFSRSPAGLMQPPSTVDTVMMSIFESPIKQKKGKLQRGRQAAAVELSDVEEDLVETEAGFSEEDDVQRPPKQRNAFTKLQKGAKKQKAIAEYNKKNSMAKDAVMDQAEESEDEYAGLGGASDDDSGVEDEETKKMIEHGEVEVDERQIAALFADKARKEDEKNINELYKNVMNGGLRRRAGGRDGFDMSDSEDEEDLRLRKKRAEFQKMNRALLADERIGNIAKDQKKQAFFHTLADFADEGDYEFLEVPADLGIDGEQSQSQEDDQQAGEGMEVITVPDSQIADATNNPLKRKSPSNSQKENRPPPNLRRTAGSDNLTRKPITLADVQHSVSELLEDSRIMVPDSQFSESESDDESPAPNVSSRKPIVDRLTLSRTSSISEAATDGGSLAFHAPSRATTAPGFRVPSLIRQATSNLSATSESRRSSGAGTPTESVRRGGTGKSNIHAQAREAERRLLLEKKDKKRKEVLRKKVSAGRKGGMRSVLGDLGGGFE
ncbi:hypothetical protein CC86DRAFT_367209 [Ophiobolus disseminans]|uniref:DNA replication checkpoint mediator MRC1 domain-containing protein n=1 Tax=Ophiobolus disseminans TaxID=1469910 RepID=A0A6A7ACL0_9PLEO|nr:hypothetical protein CC86DRAFT_367209 [Ophiobolus disseminans]